LLLEAYAFSEFGVIAMLAAVAAFVLAGVMALLVPFGLWHARRTPAEVEVGVHVSAPKVPVPV
jgi:phosphotransferase system  glucose/maltose/N-acetylglucosamine-specific IIC component